MNLPLQRCFSATFWLQTVAALFLCGLPTSRAVAQGRKPSAPTSDASSITIRGTVVAKHPGLSVAGLQYHCWQRTERQDTAVTDAAGRFILTLTAPRSWAKELGKGREVPLNVSQLADSSTHSVADRLYISALPFDTSITVELYPQVVLPDGSLPKTSALPRFPGGSGAVNRFLANELAYPDDAREAGVQGAVVVRFLVDDRGTLGPPQIVRSVSGGCSEEVLRIVGKMPAWTPGEVDSKPVPMVYYLTVRFTLE